jgi:acyl carrier protein
MDELEVRRSVAEILESSPEELTEETELESFAAYDSTGRLSLMVCLSDISGCPFEPAVLRKVRTYGDILKLIRESSKNGQGS